MKRVRHGESETRRQRSRHVHRRAPVTLREVREPVLTAQLSLDPLTRQSDGREHVASDQACHPVGGQTHEEQDHQRLHDDIIQRTRRLDSTAGCVKISQPQIVPEPLLWTVR